MKQKIFHSNQYLTNDKPAFCSSLKGHEMYAYLFNTDGDWGLLSYLDKPTKSSKKEWCGNAKASYIYLDNSSMVPVCMHMKGGNVEGGVPQFCKGVFIPPVIGIKRIQFAEPSHSDTVCHRDVKKIDCGKVCSISQKASDYDYFEADLDKKNDGCEIHMPKSVLSRHEQLPWSRADIDMYLPLNRLSFTTNCVHTDNRLSSWEVMFVPWNVSSYIAQKHAFMRPQAPVGWGIIIDLDFMQNGKLSKPDFDKDHHVVDRSIQPYDGQTKEPSDLTAFAMVRDYCD